MNKKCRWVDEDSQEWESMWQELVAKGYEIDAVDTDSGECWQYMGSWTEADGIERHEFRHRMLQGVRVYERIPAKGDQRMNTQTARRPKMTADEAQTFDKVSLSSALQIEEAISQRKAEGKHTECTCEAYSDVFTFRRWIALGMSVQKGETSLRISSFAGVSKTNDDGQEVSFLRPICLHLFCRCQVKPQPTKWRHS